MEERLTWEEIVEKYPDKWVALTNYKKDGINIKSGVVEVACPDDEIGKYDTQLLQQGKKCFWVRTTDLEGGAICLSN